MQTFQKLLVANRGEIAIRVFRTAHELGIRTVAIYSHEDRYALHRFKADEAYQVGQPGEPLRSYLNPQVIVDLARRNGVDAIHPGYGFLSENPELARACQQAGITFVGPTPEILEQLGDKTAARHLASVAKVPILAGTARSVKHLDDARRAIDKLGYPVILKAAKGGGGRGMRVVTEPGQLAGALEQAQRESLTAFGSNEVFVEKFIRRARHIEVQLLGDRHGGLVHLWERDCSLQRRHQKVVEIAPSPSLKRELREAICESAVRIGRAANYQNAGTVEFLVDADTGEFYFIEVNPRIQVEHTVTEEVTGHDIVKCQILIAQGARLDDPEVGLVQSQIETRGFAMQCRVTTEDPANSFMPDYGRITHYRSASGMGIRLDAGTAFSGAVVTPFYDSLLVKVISKGIRFVDCARRMERCLQEFRVRGVKTNIPFLINLVQHPQFLEGGCTTRFLDETPALFQFARRKDRATKLLTFMGEVIVNGNPLVKTRPAVIRREPAPVPPCDRAAAPPPGVRQKFQELGAQKFSKWIRDQKPLLLTDTTFRDAHQSLLATRMRTYDMLQVAESYARLCPQLFSLEMWGGATFDTAMRFLRECPWQRLTDLRARVPNILFQMLLRASNAVGYTNYPDNVVQAFVRESAQAGIDVFRIFDSLNWVPNMRVAMEAVNEAGALCEAAICYTGDLLNPARDKYTLKYYVELAQELEGLGAHILAIKDMAGLCRPLAARKLVKALKEELGIPIHFHTHDTAGVQASAVLNASEAGVDVVDLAIASMSGSTSQPNLNSVVCALENTPRDTKIDPEALGELSDYWERVREIYAPFDTAPKTGSAEVYLHEMPGGQYTNLREQAASMGVIHRWPEIARTYAEVNALFGDIVKVTPSSKVVGDMALFLFSRGIKPADVVNLEPGSTPFPESVIDMLSGGLGWPQGGWPEDVQRVVLGEKRAAEARKNCAKEVIPGAQATPANFEKIRRDLSEKLKREASDDEVFSHLMYPQVFADFAKHCREFSDVSVLPSSAFFYGLRRGEEIAVDIEEGKTLIIRLINVSDPDKDGRRTISFELNGITREANITDKKVTPQTRSRVKADLADPLQIGAPIPGLVAAIAVSVGQKVSKGDKLLIMEAMKMQTTVTANADGVVSEILVQVGETVESKDLILKLRN